MLRYFPFSGPFDLKMGTSLLRDTETIVETDEHYGREIELKRKLLGEDHSYYYQSILEDSQEEWEVLEKVMDDLVRHDPSSFSLIKNGDIRTYENKRLQEKQVFKFRDNSTLPLPPLDWIGRQVQEDLVILNPAGEVVAGQLCFPSGWALGEKIGKPFMEVHAPLPSLTNPMIQAANKLLERMPHGKPVSRNNWGFRLGDQLDLSSKYAAGYRKRLQEEAAGLSMATIGEKIFLRIEHQTLSRLLGSNCILFTIHTYMNTVGAEAGDPERKTKMVAFLETTPKELFEYKVMSLYADLLIRYLRQA